MEQKKDRKLIKRLRIKYRLVIMTENTFEERFSFSLTPMNVFVVLSTSIVLLAAIVISLIAFTPVREYIPGYSYSKKIGHDLEKLVVQTSELEKQVRDRDRQINLLKEIINGHSIPTDSLRNLSDSAMGQIDRLIEEKLQAMNNQEYLEGENKAAPKLTNYTFFTPVRGFITDRYDVGKEHLAVDVVSKPNEAVKATLDGTVIFASWTPETGHVIGLQHNNNLVSIYKHNSVLLKKTGNVVNAGDAIAIVGNSGEQTSGPHLHFELWHNGTALNPEEFMLF